VYLDVPLLRLVVTWVAGSVHCRVEGAGSWSWPFTSTMGRETSLLWTVMFVRCLVHKPSQKYVDQRDYLVYLTTFFVSYLRSLTSGRACLQRSGVTAEPYVKQDVPCSYLRHWQSARLQLTSFGLFWVRNNSENNSVQTLGRTPWTGHRLITRPMTTNDCTEL
jgi:hypothetical protein